MRASSGGGVGASASVRPEVIAGTLASARADVRGRRVLQRVAGKGRRRGGTSARCRATPQPRSRPSQSSFLSRSWVTVITWQPISAACTTFRISRGLAQISSRLSCGARISSASRHDRHGIAPGVGDAPGEHRDVRVRHRRAAAATSTCSSVSSAVTLSCTPSAASARWRSAVLAPCVGDRDLHVDVLTPGAIFSACSSMTCASSEKTSNEIGRSGTIDEVERERLVVLDPGGPHQRRDWS